MKVFRYEHKDTGVGPYIECSIQQWEWQDECHDGFSGRPNPDEDNIDHNDDYRYGFANTKQLSAWFSHSERVRLIQADFKLKVLWIPTNKVIHGNKQVAFYIH